MQELEIIPPNELELRDLEHKYGANKEVICTTDSLSYKQSPYEIVVDATHGFVPLWNHNSVLHWRFDERSMQRFKDVNAAKNHFRSLLDDALSEWGSAAPVKFAEAYRTVDFEYGLTPGDDCNPNGGCVLASAFFPAQVMQRLWIFPKLLKGTSYNYQVNVMVHELGHIFGLRHFFADTDETKWPSEIFGQHAAFSIMNYGGKSVLTDADRNDLRALYHGFWEGRITHVGKTRIKGITPRSQTVQRYDVSA